MIDGHPSLPYYVSATSDARVQLWQYGQSASSYKYHSSLHGRVSQIKFDTFGSHFALTQAHGDLNLWKFANHAREDPDIVLNCHSKSTYDLEFLNSSSIFATTGYSSDGRAIKVWDTLMKSKKGFQFDARDTDIREISYNSYSQIICGGGRKGELYFYDIRHKRRIKSISAHSGHISALLNIDNLLYSTAADGFIKVWDLITMETVDCFKYDLDKVKHTKNDRQLIHSAPVLEMKCIDGYVYTCGGDGNIRKIKLFK